MVVVGAEVGSEVGAEVGSEVGAEVGSEVGVGSVLADRSAAPDEEPGLSYVVATPQSLSLQLENVSTAAITGEKYKYFEILNFI